MDDHKIDLFEVIVLTFTIYISFSLGWQLSTNVNPEVVRLLSFFDGISCIIFVIDWIRRYKFAENKMKYSLYNSLDLLASIPFFLVFNYVGYFKAVRLIGIIKIIKAFGGINRIVYYLRNNQIQSLKLAFSVTFMLIMIASPILILYVEADKGNIKTAEQALWWSYCTLTTIGYGDFYPTTTIGRILAVAVSIGGIGLFGMVPGLIINHFTSNGSNRSVSSD